MLELQKPDRYGWRFFQKLQCSHCKREKVCDLDLETHEIIVHCTVCHLETRFVRVVDVTRVSL